MMFLRSCFFWRFVFFFSTPASGILQSAWVNVSPAHFLYTLLSWQKTSFVTFFTALLLACVIFLANGLATKHGFSFPFPFRRGELTRKRAWVLQWFRWHPLQLVKECPRFFTAESYCQLSTENLVKKLALSDFLRGFHLQIIACKGGSLLLKVEMSI